MSLTDTKTMGQFDQQSPHIRSELVASLKGSRLQIPDLESLFDSWPKGLSQDYLRLEEDIKKILNRLVSGSRLMKMKQSRFALFAACWWPFATYERLKVAMVLSIWLFIWDDELDSAEYSTLNGDPEAAERFRADTMRYIRSCLFKDSSILEQESAYRPIITGFKPVGIAISEAYDDSQIKVFYDALEFFVDMSGLELQLQAKGDIPTVEEYMERRMGSSATRICLAIIEYCFEMELPLEVMNNEFMDALWHSSNEIISITNDMLSIKKEVAQNAIDSLIPLLYLRHGSLEEAMRHATDMLLTSIKAFESATQQLHEQFANNPDTCDKVDKFILGCRYACRANIDWSLATGRYQLGSRSLRDGLVLEL